MYLHKKIVLKKVLRMGQFYNKPIMVETRWQHCKVEKCADEVTLKVAHGFLCFQLLLPQHITFKLNSNTKCWSKKVSSKHLSQLNINVACF